MNQGYIALTSILLISILIFVVGTSISLLSVGQTQSTISTMQSQKVFHLTEACVEEALLRLQVDNTLPTTIILPEASCDVVVNSQSGNDWDFTVTYNGPTATHSIQVEATRAESITITNWLEI